MTPVYHIKKIDQLANSEHFNLTYFLGAEYKIYQLVSERFPHLKHLRVQREQIWELVRDNLINLDQNIPNINPLWLASDLAENNLCLENFTLYILNSLALIQETVTKDEDVLIICDDDEQVLLYAKILKSNGFRVNYSVNYGILIKRLLGMLWQKSIKSAQSLYQILYLKTIRFYQKVPIPLSLIKEGEVLCINWCGPNSFATETLLHNDRYFGDLLSHLKKIGLKVVVIGKTLDFVYRFPEIVRESLVKNKNTLFLQDFLCIRAVLISFFRSFFFLKYIKYSFKIGEVNLSPLWKWFCLKDALKARIPAALEVFYASKKICKTIEKAFPCVIYPYENQPWEKLLCLSLSENGLGEKVFAYQHFPIAKEYITCYPSRASMKSKAPTLLLSDHNFGKWLKELNYQNSIVVGNFRFQKMFQSIEETRKFLDPVIKNILCCTSIQLNDSLELVSKVVQILEQLDVTIQKSIRLVVNFHPFLLKNSREAIRDLLVNKAFESKISDLSLNDLINDSYLIFYHSTSVCFDASMRGIPAIFIGSDLRINLDKMPNRALNIKNREEGVVLLNKLLNEKDYYDDICNRSRHFFNAYYKPPNYQLIQNLLQTK